METLPLLRVTRIHTVNGEVVELGDVDSEGNLVWRLSVPSAMTIYRCGIRYVIPWRDRNYELYVEPATPSSPARLRCRADGQCYALLKLLPEFGYEREKLRKAA